MDAHENIKNDHSILMNILYNFHSKSFQFGKINTIIITDFKAFSKTEKLENIFLLDGI